MKEKILLLSISDRDAIVSIISKIALPIGNSELLYNLEKVVKTLMVLPEQKNIDEVDNGTNTNTKI